jgi:hypothetical protein
MTSVTTCAVLSFALTAASVHARQTTPVKRAEQNPPTHGVAVPTDKLNHELVHGCVGTQLAILIGWETALDNFDKVLTSASDQSTNPNFTKAVHSFLQEKLMGEMIAAAKLPGVGDALALLGRLEAEITRAGEARQSATLREFFVRHRSSIGRLQQAVEASRDNFLALVRRTEERGGKEAQVMRRQLIDLRSRLDWLLKRSTPEHLFKESSEEWIRQSRTDREPAFILIRIEEDLSVRSAEIKAPYGQKIAEQLLRDSPQGVDVFGMKVRKRILYYERGQRAYYRAVLRLDASGKVVRIRAKVKYHGQRPWL